MIEIEMWSTRLADAQNGRTVWGLYSDAAGHDGQRAIKWSMSRLQWIDAGTREAVGEPEAWRPWDGCAA